MKKSIIKNILLAVFMAVAGTGAVYVYTSTGNSVKKEIPFKIESLSNNIQTNLNENDFEEIVQAKERLRKLQYSGWTNNPQKDELYKLQGIIELTSNVIKYQDEFEELRVTIENKDVSQLDESVKSATLKKLDKLENSKLHNTITKQFKDGSQFNLNSLREKFYAISNNIRELIVTLSAQS